MDFLLLKSFIVLLAVVYSIRLKYVSTPVNYYLKHKFVPDEVIRYYTEYPLSDLHFKIPIIYDIEFILPDFREAVEIQVSNRTIDEYKSLLDFSFVLKPGKVETFMENGYDPEELFVHCILNDANGLGVDNYISYGQLFYDMDSLDSNDLPYFFTQLLIDHCYGEEVSKYSPNSFYQLNDKNKLHALKYIDSMDHKFLSRFVKDSEIPVFDIRFHVIKRKEFEIPMLEAYEKYMADFINELSEIVRFRASSISYDFVENMRIEENKVYESVDDLSLDLIDLPYVTSIYKQYKNDINFIYYPYQQGGELIKTRSYYSEDTESVNIERIPDWGIIYFVNTLDEVPVEELQEAAFNYEHAILDALGVPNRSLSIKLRIGAFKRYLTSMYITEYAALLTTFNTLLKKSRFTLTGVEFKEFTEAFKKSLKTRDEIVDLVESGKVNEALELSKAMYFEFKAVVSSLQTKSV